MPDFSHLPYRSGVGMMLFNRAGQVFVAKRIDTTSEAWQMPQGGVDEGESALDACLRELQEEIGTNKATIVAQGKADFYYDLPDHLVPIIWKGKYRGQRQTWFALRFDGTDADINIATEHPEFLEWKWVNIETLPDLIVPFKRALYAALVNEFRHLAII
jgi:putative (di)nucleoside polyphosphate hydrolase